jgi:hypothetical protein
VKAWLLELLAKTKDNPVAKALAVIAIAVWGGGYSLSEVPIEPWGTLVQGIGALVGVIALVVVGKAKPKEPQ